MSKCDIQIGNSIIGLCQTITNSVTEKVHGSHKLKINAELKELGEYAESISTMLEDLKSKPKYNPTKRELRKTLKTINSLIDGLQDKALTAGSYRSHLDSDLYSAVSMVSMSASTVVEKAEEDRAKQTGKEVEPIVMTSKDGKHSPKDVLAAMKSAFQEHAGEMESESAIGRSEFTTQELDAKDKERLAKYKKFRSKVPNRVERFEVAQLPVVPLFKDFNLMSERVLTTANISHTMIGQHLVVLDRQIILAYNRRAVTKGRNTPKSKQAQTKLDKSYEQEIYELVDVINERSNVKYSVVSKKFIVNDQNKHIIFAWLMPVSQLARLRHSANDTKGIELISWGFPWKV